MTKFKNDDPLYRLLRDGDIRAFNEQRKATAELDFSDCDFRGLDLRGLDARGINFDNAYFRQTDLRGIDLSSASHRGATIKGANISGTYFPTALRAEEIKLSYEQGTRMRYKD